VKKRIIIILVAFAALTGTASAATWTLTERQAESFVTRNVIVRDSEAIEEATFELKSAKQQLAIAEKIGEPAGISAGLQQVGTAEAVLSDAKYGYRARRLTCRGDSPSRDAYRFSRFRCEALWVGKRDIAGWGRGTVTVVGKNRAVWRWLP
jgi:cell wall-associated NlpC family hydrolase